jgi:protease-4
MRASTNVALVALVASILGLFAAGARGQGLDDPRSGLLLPQTQAAAVDDAAALLVNPAGLGFVDGLELGGGWTTRATPTTTPTIQHSGDAYAVIGGDGVALGGDFGVVAPDGRTGLLRGSLATGLRLDDGLAVGGAFHAQQTLVPGVDDTSWDVGVQLRPARWLAVGLVGEQLGRKTGGESVRAGLSWRPVGEWLTIGADVRATPGPSRDSASAWAAAAWTPALAARLQWGGLGVYAGVAVRELQAVASGPVTVIGSGGVQVDLERIGLALGAGANGTDVLGAVRARASTTSWASLLPASGRWLQIELGADAVPVQRHRTLFDELFGDTPSSTAVLASLDATADDPSVEGLVLQLAGVDVGWARAGELRAALVRLRSHGKKVVVHFDVANDVEAYIASAADRIWMSPSGALEVDGIRAEMVYVGDTLRRFGFAAEAVAAGRYKSAPRAFTHDAPSPEELEVEAALLDGVYAALVDGLAQGRGLTVDDVRSAIDQGGLSPAEALSRRLVDGLVYVDEVADKVAELAGRSGQPLLLERGWLEPSTRSIRWDAPQQIAFIPVQGTIRMGSSRGGLLGSDGAGSDDVVEAIREAAGDDAVKAIVLRIDSPGGDALASDLIWRAAMLAREKKPVIASMGDVAASGGYYIASAAHEVLASKTTITGSIGVFGLLFNAENFASDNGVRVYEQKRGARPGPTLLRPMTDDERSRIQESVNATYERFLDAVVAGRTEKRLKKDDLRAVAEGRVWTGADALARKLVDREGTVVDAIKLARERAGLGADAPIAVRVITGTEGELSGLGGVQAVARVLSSTLGLDERAALARSVALLVGDASTMALAIDGEGRPLALGPGFTVR